MKTEFELEMTPGCKDYNGSMLIITDGSPMVALALNNPYVTAFIKDDELEEFAVNILKALKSKRLTSNQ